MPVAERLAEPLNDTVPLRLGDSEGFAGRVLVGEVLRDRIGETLAEGDLVPVVEPVLVTEDVVDFDAEEESVSERVTRILGDPEGEPETDLVLTGEPDTDRVIIEDRVPEALLDTEAEPVEEREFDVEPVAVLDAELVRVADGLPDTDLVGLGDVLVDMVTVAERLALGDTELLTVVVTERER